MTRLTIDWLIYVCVRLLICIVQAMPIELCSCFARPLAMLAARIVRVRHSVIDDNLRHAFPSWTAQRREQVTIAMWEHLVLLICEIAHLSRKVHETNWRDYVRLNNLRPQVAALLSPQPCVVLSGHFGNFEAGGYLLGMFGFKTHTIARPLDNVFLDRWLNRFRQANGQVILPRKGVAQQIGVLLQRGGNLVLLGDQYGGAKGCWVDFFGRPASYHKAIAMFTLTSGAPLVVSSARRINGRPMQFELKLAGVHDPATADDQFGGARQLTQWYNDLLQDMIRNDVEQYWWLHRRWKGAPHRRQPKQKAAA